MKAAQIHAFGGADVLVYAEAPMPEPGAGEVRIKVRAVGVNPVDWKIWAGPTEAGMPHQLPLVLGWEAAGDIDALGPGVTDFAVGDPVYTMTDFSCSGTYAEYAVVTGVRGKSIGVWPNGPNPFHRPADFLHGRLH